MSRRDLFYEMVEKIERAMDEFMRNMMAVFTCPYRAVGVVEEGYRVPEYQVNESGNELLVTIDMPGVPKENISVKVTDEGELIVRGEGEERRYVLRLRLPRNVDLDSIRAVYRNGVLSIRMRKVAEEEKAKKIEVLSE